MEGEDRVSFTSVGTVGRIKIGLGSHTESDLFIASLFYAKAQSIDQFLLLYGLILARNLGTM